MSNKNANITIGIRGVGANVSTNDSKELEASGPIRSLEIVGSSTPNWIMQTRAVPTDYTTTALYIVQGCFM